MNSEQTILSDEAFLQILAERLSRKEPTSVVRKGDGENILLGFGLSEDFPFKAYRKKMKHYNIHLWDLALQLKLRSELARAYANADFLGISSAQERQGYWKNEQFILDYYALNQKIFFDMNFHFQFIKKPDQKQLLNHSAQTMISGKKIGIVSHWDVSAFLKENDSELICRLSLPKRRSRFSFMTRSLFDAILQDLKSKARQADIWLMAAGPYAKPFCQAVKTGGGFALDIGSSMDSWMNVYETRGHLRRIAKEYREEK